MIPKGNNVGLNTREKIRWTRDAIFRILEEHGLYEAVGFSDPTINLAVANDFLSLSDAHRRNICEIAVEMNDSFAEFLKPEYYSSIDPNDTERHMSVVYTLMVASRRDEAAKKILLKNRSNPKIKMAETVGINHLVSYLCPRVFQWAEKEEEWAFAKMTLPDHRNAPVVIRAAKPYIVDGNIGAEAIDAAFGASRERKLSSFLFPLLQEDAMGQVGLGKFIRRHMACSSPSQLDQMVRMRRYAIDHGHLGNQANDNPQEIIRYYFESIVKSIGEASFPENLKPIILEMLRRGEGEKKIKALISLFNSIIIKQSIPPSIKEFEGIVFEVVGKNNPIVLSAGEINNSCMTFGGVANACVVDILTNSRAALMVMRLPFVKSVELNPNPYVESTQENIREWLMQKCASGGIKFFSEEGGEYIGYCYLRHGLSGTLYIDNVETNHKMVTPSVRSGLVKWIISMSDELKSPRVLIGKAYSNNILDKQGLGDTTIEKNQLMDDMPEKSGAYADICNKDGAWEYKPKQSEVKNGVFQEVETQEGNAQKRDTQKRE